MIELKPVAMQHTYEIGDESGYRYTVHASHDEEFGSWSAAVTIQTWGLKTPEAAVEAMTPALANLLRKLNETPTSTDRPSQTTR